MGKKKKPTKHGLRIYKWDSSGKMPTRLFKNISCHKNILWWVHTFLHYLQCLETFIEPLLLGSTLSTVLILLRNSGGWELSLSLFYRCENWGIKRLSNLLLTVGRRQEFLGTLNSYLWAVLPNCEIIVEGVNSKELGHL